MSCEAKLCFEENGLDAGNLGHFMDLNVGDEITPRDVYDDPAPYRRMVSATAL